MIVPLARLGFGCTGLMTSLSLRDSLYLLDTAYDQGIRDFDVAPSYGFGLAEDCLGKFALAKSDVSITTKVGIARPRSSMKVRAGRAVIVASVGTSSGLGQWLLGRRSKSIRKDQTVNQALTPQLLREALESSLRALRRDSVNTYLLHEYLDAPGLSEDLLASLQSFKDEGKICRFGIGARPDLVEKTWRALPQLCTAIQTEWSIYDRPLAYDAQFLAVDRVIQRSARSLTSHLTDQAMALDVAGVALRAAVTSSRANVVLFSSKRAEHIKRNVELASSNLLDSVIAEIRH